MKRGSLLREFFSTDSRTRSPFIPGPRLRQDKPKSKCIVGALAVPDFIPYHTIKRPAVLLLYRRIQSLYGRDQLSHLLII